MTMKLWGLFELESDPVDLAVFAMTLLDMLKEKYEYEKAHKDMLKEKKEYDDAHEDMSSNEMMEELLKAYGDTTIEELIKKESEEENEST